MSMLKFVFISAVAALAIATAGCYDDPGETASPQTCEKTIYLKNTGLQHLSVESVYEKGLVYDTSWTNLSSRVSPEEFKSRVLSEINYLNLDYNALTNIDAVASFPSLKWLRLNSNRLTSLPAGGFARLSKLRRIYLSDNKFTSVPEVLSSLSSLKEIDLSWNPGITEVPPWFAEMRGLEDLSLTGTSITSLPADISSWRSLRLLRLGELKMSSEEMKRIRDALPETTVVF